MFLRNLFSSSNELDQIKLREIANEVNGQFSKDFTNYIKHFISENEKKKYGIENDDNLTHLLQSNKNYFPNSFNNYFNFIMNSIPSTSSPSLSLPSTSSPSSNFSPATFYLNKNFFYEFQTSPLPFIPETPVSPFLPLLQPIYQGYMFKLGYNVKSWKKRYFIVYNMDQNYLIKYYDAKPENIITSNTSNSSSTVFIPSSFQYINSINYKYKGFFSLHNYMVKTFSVNEVFLYNSPYGIKLIPKNSKKSKRNWIFKFNNFNTYKKWLNIFYFICYYSKNLNENSTSTFESITSFFTSSSSPTNSTSDQLDSPRVPITTTSSSNLPSLKQIFSFNSFQNTIIEHEILRISFLHALRSSNSCYGYFDSIEKENYCEIDLLYDYTLRILNREVLLDYFQANSNKNFSSFAITSSTSSSANTNSTTSSSNSISSISRSVSRSVSMTISSSPYIDLINHFQNNIAPPSSCFDENFNQKVFDIFYLYSYQEDYSNLLAYQNSIFQNASNSKISSEISSNNNAIQNITKLLYSSNIITLTYPLPSFVSISFSTKNFNKRNISLYSNFFSYLDSKINSILTPIVTNNWKTNSQYKDKKVFLIQDSNSTEKNEKKAFFSKKMTNVDTYLKKFNENLNEIIKNEHIFEKLIESKLDQVVYPIFDDIKERILTPIMSEIFNPLCEVYIVFLHEIIERILWIFLTNGKEKFTESFQNVENSSVPPLSNYSNNFANNEQEIHDILLALKNLYEDLESWGNLFQDDVCYEEILYKKIHNIEIPITPKPPNSSSLQSILSGTFFLLKNFDEKIFLKDYMLNFFYDNTINQYKVFLDLFFDFIQLSLNLIYTFQEVLLKEINYIKKLTKNKNNPSFADKEPRNSFFLRPSTSSSNEIKNSINLSTCHPTHPTGSSTLAIPSIQFSDDGKSDNSTVISTNEKLYRPNRDLNLILEEIEEIYSNIDEKDEVNIFNTNEEVISKQIHYNEVTGLEYDADTLSSLSKKEEKKTEEDGEDVLLMIPNTLPFPLSEKSPVENNSYSDTQPTTTANTSNSVSPSHSTKINSSYIPLTSNNLRENSLQDFNSPSKDQIETFKINTTTHYYTKFQNQIENSQYFKCFLQFEAILEAFESDLSLFIERRLLKILLNLSESNIEEFLILPSHDVFQKAYSKKNLDAYYRKFFNPIYLGEKKINTLYKNYIRKNILCNELFLFYEVLSNNCAIIKTKEYIDHIIQKFH